MDAKQLEKIGLSPNEAKFYVALRGLREKGLVSQITKANKLLFEAGNPEKIWEIIKEKEDQLEVVKKIVPELLLDFKMAKQKQEIHSFKGLAGIKTVLNGMLKSTTEI